MVRPQDSPVVKESTEAADVGGGKPDRISTSIFMSRQTGEAPVTEVFSVKNTKPTHTHTKKKHPSTKIRGAQQMTLCRGVI